jgi:peroxiredoxin Q/BCP
LLSDFNKVAIKDYDVVNPEFSAGYLNVAKRSTFVIDKNGIIKKIFPSVDVNEHHKEIIDALAKL